MFGRIYCIESNCKTSKYIGSTTKSLDRRFRQHVNNYNCWKKGKRSKVATFDIFDMYGYDNCSISLLEEGWFDDLHSLRSRENEYIANTTCINRYKAIQTKDERREYMKMYLKQKVQCKCGIELIRSSLPQHIKTTKHKTRMGL